MLSTWFGLSSRLGCLAQPKHWSLGAFRRVRLLTPIYATITHRTLGKGRFAGL